MFTICRPNDNWLASEIQKYKYNIKNIFHSDCSRSLRSEIKYGSELSYRQTTMSCYICKIKWARVELAVCLWKSLQVWEARNFPREELHTTAECFHSLIQLWGKLQYLQLAREQPRESRRTKSTSQLSAVIYHLSKGGFLLRHFGKFIATAKRHRNVTMLRNVFIDKVNVLTLHNFHWNSAASRKNL